MAAIRPHSPTLCPGSKAPWRASRSDAYRRLRPFLGGLDILVSNAGATRGGRIEAIEEDAIRQMIEVNLAAPILLTRSALPALRASSDAVIVNISSASAQIGIPFYATQAATKAGITRFGEALRRELAGEGVGVLTVYPVATDTPMLATSRMQPAGGFDSAEAVARETVEAIVANRIELTRGGAERRAMIALNHDDPAAVDRELASMKPALAAQAETHSAL